VTARPAGSFAELFEQTEIVQEIDSALEAVQRS
jgi:hypothetical protein